MLAALLLLGLLPAAFLFEPPHGAGQRTDEDEADGDDWSGDGSADGSSAGGSAPAAGAPGVDPAGDTGNDGLAEDSAVASDGVPPDDSDDPDAGQDDDAHADDAHASVTVVPESGEALIEGFRPGVDTLTLRLSAAPAGFYTSSDEATGTPSLHVEGAEGEHTLTFAGLAAVPTGDIIVSVPDPASGLARLGALVAPGDDPDGADGADLGEGGPADATDPPDTGESPDDADPLQPSDPEAPSDVTPADPDDADPLQPSDPEAPSVITPADPDDSEPLRPVPPETPPVVAPAGYLDGYNEISGTEGDDALTFGDGDLVHGAGGADHFHLYTAGTSPATIDDFAPGDDFLRITLDARQHVAMPEVSVGPSADGADGEVRVAGTLVAILTGAPGVTEEDVYVELLPDMVA